MLMVANSNLSAVLAGELAHFFDFLIQEGHFGSEAWFFDFRFLMVTFGSETDFRFFFDFRKVIFEPETDFSIFLPQKVILDMRLIFRF